MINKLKSIYFYLLYKVNKLKSAKIVCLEMVRLLCSEIWVFAFVGWRYVPSPPVLSRVNNNVMLIICHTVQHKIDFYLWNFKSTIRRMCLFMFWCWACHKTESTDLPFEYEHVCHGVSCPTFFDTNSLHFSRCFFRNAAFRNRFGCLQMYLLVSFSITFYLGLIITLVARVIKKLKSYHTIIITSWNVVNAVEWCK